MDDKLQALIDQLAKPGMSEEGRPPKSTKIKSFSKFNGRRKIGPRPPPPTEAPRPQHLSKTATPLTTDPLYLEAFVIDGEQGMTYRPKEQVFCPDASGLISLSHREYRTMATAEPKTIKALPESAFTYYNTMLFWYKIALHMRKRGMATPDCDRLIAFVGDETPHTTAGVATYLSGLGDFTDTLGVRHVLECELPTLGDFGRIDAETHYIYETLPAPRIAYARVLADLNSEGSYWTIRDIEPEPFEPPPPPPQPEAPRRGRRRAPSPPQPPEPQIIVVNPGYDREMEDDLGSGGSESDTDSDGDEDDVLRSVPTVNLLGWYPSQPLTANQRRELERLHLNNDFVNGTFCLNRELFSWVRNIMEGISKYVQSPIQPTVSGSTAQQNFWVPEEYTSFNQTTYYCDLVGSVEGHTEVTSRIAVASKVMAYRSLASPMTDVHDRVVNPWACYSFNEYADVPPGWSNNRNRLRVRGVETLVRNREFRTATSARTNVVDSFLRSKITR